ncbi:tRNA(Ile)(2)-agmatinylcytidine synthase [Halocatena halophila]|uniref:tRNA(Ile)(2)-agmatinylcytidine synthase n=1 Tax=Halocatena halophila TaxID=2814576 RepID=UPI002ED06E14
MTVIGIDDTDSRAGGMCTTYVAHRLITRLRDEEATPPAVRRPLLVRLNPAVEHKTRGNGALAVQTTLDPDPAQSIATALIEELAVVDDPRTNPGVVLAPNGDWTALDPHDAVVAFARSALTEQLTIADAERVIEVAGYRAAGWGNGRGRIGALAAIGAMIARQQSITEGVRALPPFDEWTYECLSYRERDRWGTPREVDGASVRSAVEGAYPSVWDTIDSDGDELVCVPHTPCPILHGIRGDDPIQCERVASAIESEPVAARRLFVTNQGTDAHLQDGSSIDELGDRHAYRIDGTIDSAPETKRGGHVFTTLMDETGTIDCVAFAPTARFRAHVRKLRVGDDCTVCGEVSGGTLKLEKFAVRSLTETERVTPTCPDCARRMKSAGAGQGYRCRNCGTSAPGKVEQPIDRDLEEGWYEVPPSARRHVAKPLVRGGFDGVTHPER